MLTYLALKDKPVEFLAATSLTPDEFLKLLPAFIEAEKARYPPDRTTTGKCRQRRAGAGVKGCLHDPADRLLFILVYQKTYPLQTMQGLQFGLSQPQTNYWIQRLLPVLECALTQLGQMPERDPQQVAQSPWLAQAPADLLTDGTERRRQRPQDPEQQRAHYSGKKKTHTDKNLLLVNAQTQQVIYLSPTEPGTRHDKKLADEQAITYPSGTSLGKDTGFQGYEPLGVSTYQPKKNRRDDR